MRPLRKAGVRGKGNLRGRRMDVQGGRNHVPGVREEGKMREEKIVAFFAGLFVFAFGAVVAVSVFVCLAN